MMPRPSSTRSAPATFFFVFLLCQGAWAQRRCVRTWESLASALADDQVYDVQLCQGVQLQPPIDWNGTTNTEFPAKRITCAAEIDTQNAFGGAATSSAQNRCTLSNVHFKFRGWASKALVLEGLTFQYSHLDVGQSSLETFVRHCTFELDSSLESKSFCNPDCYGHPSTLIEDSVFRDNRYDTAVVAFGGNGYYGSVDQFRIDRCYFVNNVGASGTSYAPVAFLQNVDGDNAVPVVHDSYFWNNTGGGHSGAIYRDACFWCNDQVTGNDGRDNAPCNGLAGENVGCQLEFDGAQPPPVDYCPDDPLKSTPGACGCRKPEDDADGDRRPDCVDACPDDPRKWMHAGACGCGQVDTDADGDGTPDCHDACPADPLKTEQGACGCGTPEDDADKDGTPDCLDTCPTDPKKTAPGFCGCGRPDDADQNGVLDCQTTAQINVVLQGLTHIMNEQQQDVYLAEMERLLDHGLQAWDAQLLQATVVHQQLVQEEEGAARRRRLRREEDAAPQRQLTTTTGLRVATLLEGVQNDLGEGSYEILVAQKSEWMAALQTANPDYFGAMLSDIADIQLVERGKVQGSVDLVVTGFVAGGVIAALAICCGSVSCCCLRQNRQRIKDDEQKKKQQQQQRRSTTASTQRHSSRRRAPSTRRSSSQYKPPTDTAPDHEAEVTDRLYDDSENDEVFLAALKEGSSSDEVDTTMDTKEEERDSNTSMDSKEGRDESNTSSSTSNVVKEEEDAALTEKEQTTTGGKTEATNANQIIIS